MAPILVQFQGDMFGRYIQVASWYRCQERFSQKRLIPVRNWVQDLLSVSQTVLKTLNSLNLHVGTEGFIWSKWGLLIGPCEKFSIKEQLEQAKGDAAWFIGHLHLERDSIFLYSLLEWKHLQILTLMQNTMWNGDCSRDSHVCLGRFTAVCDVPVETVGCDFTTGRLHVPTPSHRKTFFK